jgi:hypothetical protein
MTLDWVAPVLAVLTLVGLLLVGRRLRAAPPRPRPRAGGVRNWRTHRFWRWLVVWWIGAAAIALTCTSAAADGPRRAYTTSHPGKADWLGLATQDGRYEIVLGDGCDAIGPDMNVLADTSDDEHWTVQLLDADQVCSVAEWHWQGNTPCFTNADGACDVAGEQD